MPLRLIRLRFGDLPVNGKFLGKLPGRKKRVGLVKLYDNRAREEGSTMWHEFSPKTMVYVWRWASY